MKGGRQPQHLVCPTCDTPFRTETPEGQVVHCPRCRCALEVPAPLIAGWLSKLRNRLCKSRFHQEVDHGDWPAESPTVPYQNARQKDLTNDLTEEDLTGLMLQEARHKNAPTETATEESVLHWIAQESPHTVPKTPHKKPLRVARKAPSKAQETPQELPPTLVPKQAYSPDRKVGQGA